MDTKQPEALRLADAMERFTKSSHWWTDGEPIHIAVAAELRSLHTENDTLRAGYDAARLEIESLQAQAQQCGAGAGCCAQAARIAELEAQIEAGGVQRIAGPDTTPVAQAMRIFWQQHTRADALSMTMVELHADVERVIRAARGAAPSNGTLAAPAQPRDDAVFVVWWSDHMPNSTEADAWAEWCALRSNQPPAQAQDARQPLADEQIEALPVWSHFVGLWPESRKEIARAIEDAIWKQNS